MVGPRRAYSDWLVEVYAEPLKLWGMPMLLYNVATLVQHAYTGKLSTAHAIIMCSGCLSCWAITQATLRRRTSLLRILFLYFGFSEMAFYLTYLWEGKMIAKVHLHLDFVTYMYSVTPQLLIGLNGAPVAAYILFVGCHVATAALLHFQFHMGKMPWPLAVLRALVAFTLPVSATLLLHKWARASFRSYEWNLQQRELLSQLRQQKHHDRQQPGLQGPSKAASATHSNAAAEHDPLPSSEQSNVAAVCAPSLPSWLVMELASSTKVLWNLWGLMFRSCSPLRDHPPTSQGAQTHSTHEKERGEEQAQQQAPPQEALKAQAHAGPETQGMRRPEPYASKLNQVSNLDPGRTLRSVRQTIRVIVTLHGSYTPDCIPEGGLAELKHTLKLPPYVTPALRMGCLVISFDVTLGNAQDHTLEDICAGVSGKVKQWAHKQGLSDATDGLLTVQACPSTEEGFVCVWDSTPDKQPSTLFGMAVHAPFLVPGPDSITPVSAMQQQQQQQQQDKCAEAAPGNVGKQPTPQQQKQQQEHERVEGEHAMGKPGCARNQAPEHFQEQMAPCDFELNLLAPPDLELRGWQGVADAPEELPDAIKSHSLSLLASLDGQFLGVTVKDESLRANGERVAQVCVSLPAKSLDTASSCPKDLALELWTGGSLVCYYSAVLLLSPSAAAALAELQGWAAGLTEAPPGGSGLFMRDLALWVRFQAAAQQQHTPHHPNSGVVAAEETDLLDSTMQQQLELMSGVGMDLLEYSLRCGLEAVAGLLLECLASLPFRTLHTALLDTHPLRAKLTPQSKLREADDDEKSPQATPHAALPPTSSAHISPPAASAPSTPASAAPLETNPGAVGTTTPGSALHHASAVPSALLCKLAAVASSLCAQPSKEEVDYRAWTNALVAPLARAWCSLSMLNMGLGALRMGFAKAVPPLLEVSAWGVMLLGYTMGALFIRPSSISSEHIIATLSVARASYAAMMGLGMIPISYTNQLVFRWRMEVAIEILMMSVMERVRLSWMVPLRGLLMVGLWLVYARLGFCWPAAQSALLNLCSLGVTALMEWRYRKLYTPPALHANRQALANKGASHSQESEPGNLVATAKAGEG